MNTPTDASRVVEKPTLMPIGLATIDVSPQTDPAAIDSREKIPILGFVGPDRQAMLGVWLT